MRKVFLLTGVSGAGKSTISHVFEEFGYRIIENAPNVVLPSLAEEIIKNDAYERTVLIVEIRHAAHAISILRQLPNLEVLVCALDCAAHELLTRYRLTRHIHPLQAKGLTLEECLEKDAADMKNVRPLADLYLDTTGLSVSELRRLAFAHLAPAGDKMVVTFSSFGYKYGIPQDAELIFDCRNVPNPFWDPSLRSLTGLDKPVIDFLSAHKETEELFNRMTDYLDYFLPSANAGGRNYVNVDLGCSGGQHRSVYFAQALYEHYKAKYICFVSHREMKRYIGGK